MRWLILIPIYIYWYILPSCLKKRTCLFKESCSHFVFRTTRDNGFIAGAKALIWRFRSCRNGYRIISNSEGKLEMRLVTGNVVPETEIADAILKPYITAISAVMTPEDRVKHFFHS